MVESPWLVTEADEIPRKLSVERKFVEGHLKSKNSQLLVAVDGNGKIIGSLGGDGGSRRRNKHLLTIGIVVLKECRGHGIGVALSSDQAEALARRSSEDDQSISLRAELAKFPCSQLLDIAVEYFGPLVVCRVRP